MRRHSTSYSMRPPESLTTPYWRPPAGAAARLPPAKTRRPLNCGTGSAASTLSAIALTMTGSSATSLPIATDKTPRESGHRTPCLPSCGALPRWPLHAATGSVSAPAPRGTTGGQRACAGEGPRSFALLPEHFRMTKSWTLCSPFLTGHCVSPWGEWTDLPTSHENSPLDPLPSVLWLH